MKSYTILTLLAVLAAGTACTYTNNPATYTVNGTLPDSTANGKMVYLANRNNNQTLDSTLVVDGKFTFTGKMDTATLSMVRVDRFYSNFMLENGTITLDLARPNHAEGTPLNVAWTQFMEAKDSLNQVISNKQKEIMAMQVDNEEKDKLFSEFFDHEWKPAYMRVLDRFYHENQTNDVGVAALTTFNQFYSIDQMDSLVNTASAFLKSRRPVIDLIERIAVLRETAEGKPFVDFTIDTEDGGKVSLSDYVGKGKYTLVDFWASWCGPCRGETPVIAEIYNQYKNKGLQVLGVAVWDQPDATKKAIEELNITWPQILNANDIPTKKYGINGIPHIILFGPDGTIVARNLRGDQMKAKIKEVMEKK